ncbi:sigma factor-like helix-turn-helix DNA-binding protein [Sorangium sp. So ce1097]|uniref:RNA polymerase sigma factor n=1 Tax=Sorangium sp. So ce1097 TaxID=3133330 RepID=UPI003F6446BA
MTLPSPSFSSARPSFETVYTVGLPFLHQALRWLGVAADDLDDMLQEIFLAAYRGLDTYEPWRYHAAPRAERPAAGPPPLRIKPEAALHRWLFGIAWRKSSHYHARAHRRREIPSGAGGSWPFDGRDPTPTPEQTLASADRAEIVTALLLKVAPERRVILVMYDVLGVPVADIARELHLKENTVRSRLRLAREDFRAAIARQPRERRSALRPLPAQERSLEAFAASLLRRVARAFAPLPVFPAPPTSTAHALWIRLQQRMLLEKCEAGGPTGSLTPPHVCVVSAPLAEKVLRSWPILRSGMSVCVTNGSPPRSRRSA